MSKETKIHVGKVIIFDIKIEMIGEFKHFECIIN